MSAITATVTKVHRGYVVEGVFAVVAGKMAREPFEQFFSAKRDALAYAGKIDQINAEAVRDFQRDRERAIAEVVARRAARQGWLDTQVQLSLF